VENIVPQTQLLPWQDIPWQQFLQRYQRRQLPHALLLHAAAGLGRLALAQHIAQFVLCEGVKQDKACDRCASCRLFLAKSHPDYFLIQAEENSDVIKIEAIRSLIEKLTQSTQLAGYRVIIIDPADRMNIAAGNALLKTLEEPIDNTLIILSSEYPERLPATLRSRCQLLRIPLPSDTVARHWLQQQDSSIDGDKWLALAGGAPLLAEKMGQDEELQTQYRHFIETLQQFQREQDPLEAAAAWMSLDVFMLCTWLAQFYMDLIRLSINASPEWIVHKEYSTWLQQSSKLFPLSSLFIAYDKIIELHKLFVRQSNLNLQLQLEAKLIEIINIKLMKY